MAEHLPRLATRRKLDLVLLLAALQAMPVEWQPASRYEHQRADAEQRMADRDPEDWPTVAVALAHGCPIWSQDKDMQASGLAVVTTGELLDALAEDA